MSIIIIHMENKETEEIKQLGKRFTCNNCKTIYYSDNINKKESFNIYNEHFCKYFCHCPICNTENISYIKIKEE